SFFCALTLLVGLGTLTEWHFKRQATINAKRIPGSACRVLIWFSVVTNTQRLFDTSQFKGTAREPLLFLSGIKLILCFWVVFFHSYTIIQPEFYHSGFKIFDLGDRIYFQLIVNAFLSISSLFFIRGFTFSFFMNETSTYRGSGGYFRTYIFATIKRYLRLTMPVVVVMLLAFLLPIMADGPADQELFTQQINGCAKNWWTVLVHTNNFNPLNESCLTSLWYVSTEMQVFVITLPLTMLLSRFPRTAATILVLTALGFSIYTTLRTYFWNLFFSMTTGTNNGKRLFQTLELICFRPFTHVATYVCGILSGYAAVHYKKRNIPYLIQSTLWLLSATAAAFVMFVTVPWNRGNLPDDITNALYGGFHRLVWSLALCWPIYACATGHGGIIAWMSSWKGFIPLARLTYGVYLLHGLFLLLRMGLVKSRFNLDEFFQLTNTLGIIALSYYFAYLLYLRAALSARFQVQRRCLISSNGLLTNSMFEYNIASVGGYEQCLRTEARDPDSIRKLLELMDKVHFQIIVNSPLSVTTFFFLRLVFPAMVMVLVAFVLPLVVDGPADDDFFADQTKGCYKNWWTAMTLSLNFNGVSETLTGSEEVSSECMSALFRTAFSLKQQEPWALRLVFSSGGIPNNAFEGSTASLGSYEHAFIAASVAAVALGTCLELYHFKVKFEYPKRKLFALFVKTLLCFSCVRNFRELMNTREERGTVNDKLRFVHGVRVTMILWVILGGAYFYTQVDTFHNAVEVFELPKKPAFQLVSASFLAVSTFFFVRSVVWAGFLALCLATLGPYASGYITHRQFLFPGVTVAPHDINRSIRTSDLVFIMPYSNAGPYFVGMIAGYMSAEWPNIKMHWLIQAFFWVGAVSTNLVLVFLPLLWNSAEDESYRLLQAFYAGGHQVIWGMAWSWIFYACCTGRAGLAVKVLSWEGFVIPARLTFGAYLVHYLVFVARGAVTTTAFQLNEFLQ
ncbi:hypothetical protein HPB47_023705, partial [Ixodes persulcatus]